MIQYVNRFLQSSTYCKGTRKGRQIWASNSLHDSVYQKFSSIVDLIVKILVKEDTDLGVQVLARFSMSIAFFNRRFNCESTHEGRQQQDSVRQQSSRLVRQLNLEVFLQRRRNMSVFGCTIQYVNNLSWFVR